MTDAFFAAPILNSPYSPPSRHWELDESGQPTPRIDEGRQKASFVTPIPKTRKQSRAQTTLIMDKGKGLSISDQQYDIRSLINELRIQVERWRPGRWVVAEFTDEYAMESDFTATIDAAVAAIIDTATATRHA